MNLAAAFVYGVQDVRNSHGSSSIWICGSNY